MSKKQHLYFIINKPYGVLSQFSNEGEHPGLGTLYNLPKDVYPVGRLDRDSEGLLILTNDKSVNNSLLNPKFLHQRTYFLEVEGEPNAEALNELGKGVTINLKGQKYQTSPSVAQLMPNYQIEEREPSVNRKKHPITSWLSLTITEGKNRQVRRMTAQICHPTLRLIRHSIESLELGNIPAGGIAQLSMKTIYEKLKLDHSTFK